MVRGDGDEAGEKKRKKKKKKKKVRAEVDYDAVPVESDDGAHDHAIDVPPGWEQHKDEHTGHVYYYNTQSGETRWELPSHKESRRRRSLRSKRRSKPKSKAGKTVVAAQASGVDKSGKKMVI